MSIKQISLQFIYMIWTNQVIKHSVMVMAGEIKGSMDDCSYRFNNGEACYCGSYMGPLLTSLRSWSWPPSMGQPCGFCRFVLCCISLRITTCFVMWPSPQRGSTVITARSYMFAIHSSPIKMPHWSFTGLWAAQWGPINTLVHLCEHAHTHTHVHIL